MCKILQWPLQDEPFWILVNSIHLMNVVLLWNRLRLISTINAYFSMLCEVQLMFLLDHFRSRSRSLGHRYSVDVLQYELVCDRAYLVHLIETSLLLGAAVGALAAGQLADRCATLLSAIAKAYERTFLAQLQLSRHLQMWRSMISVCW